MADQAARQLQYEYKANSNLVLQVMLVGTLNFWVAMVIGSTRSEKA